MWLTIPQPCELNRWAARISTQTVEKEFMIEETRFRGVILNTCIGALVFILLGSLWAVFGLWSLHGKGTLMMAISLGLCALLLLIVSVGSLRTVLRLPQDILTAERRERIARIK